MAIGDVPNMLARLRGALPTAWFPTTASESPLTTYVLTGFAQAASLIYQQAAYAQLQTRIGTSTDGWLDLTSVDYFGSRLPRRNTEADAQYRGRIQRELLRERATRNALIQVLHDTTGNYPTIFENRRPLDGVCLDIPTSGLDHNGGTSGDDFNYQVFIKIARPLGGGIPNIPGLDFPQAGTDVGTLTPTDDSMSLGLVATDSDIYAAAESVRPDGVIYWVSLTGPALPQYLPLGQFILGVSLLGNPPA